ncbi:MAG TPA: hypothetical protein VEU51_01110 [Candidatus Acidoferrales bacterium]|nr:hypothetical protein [Candidatus Acidoferrales bacterium]
MKKLRLIRPEIGAASARTAIVLAAATWLPLLVLSIVEGLAVGGASIPFLYDIAAHTRFLVAVPILVLAEIPIGRRLRGIARQFLNAGLVPESERKQFASYAVDTVRFHDSRLAEIALLAVTYTMAYVIFSQTSFQSGSTWYHPSASGFSVAGYYYAFIAVPIFQFLLYRWAFRMFVWARLLWQISNLDLSLTPTHPDGAGGLGFLGKGTIPFGVILFAMSSVVSASIASRILFDGAKLEQFEFIYAALILSALIVFAGPLLVFAPKLFRLKQEGLLRYGELASEYTQLFDRKWVGRIDGAEEPLLGSGDIQSLADLGNSYELVRKMRVVPIELSDFIAIALPGVIPALPLAATVMPVSEILKQILRLLG